MRFQCQNCQKIVAIDDSECGQPVGCGHCGSITIVPQTRFSPNALINDFVIRSTLGNGGMGTVYLAHQLSLDRPVALKILMEQFAHNSEFIVDFVREARAAARLNHPNIVQSYAVGEDDGVYFFAMEYVEGKTLKTLLNEEGKLEWQRAFNIIQQIAEALDFAWKNQQLIHRDIKPDNIMLTRRGVAKLADLGLARAAHETSDDDDDEVMGTPQYICPEQLLGQPMDVRGDIYSLGATLFHALTGNFPYEGNSAAEIARKHLNAPVPDPRDFDKSVPEEACYVIEKMMAKRLEDRYEDAEELVVDMGFILRGQKPAGFKAGKGPVKKPVKKPAKSPAKNPAKKTHGGIKSRTKTGKVGRVTKNTITAGQPKITKTGAPAAKKVSPASSNPPESPSGDSAMSRSATKTGTKTKMKTARIKTGTKTSTNLSSDTQTGQTGTYRRPGEAPVKGGGNGNGGGGKVVVAVLLVLILAIIGTIAWFVAQYLKYDFKSKAVAKQMYLDEAVSKAEREAYMDLAVYSQNGDFLQGNFDVKDAGKVLAMTDDFLNNYPKSIFTRTDTPSRTEMAKKIFKTPGQIEMFIGENTINKTKPWLGQVLRFRDQVARPRYVLFVRSGLIEDEDRTIALNILENKFNETKAKVWEELEAYAGEIVDNYKTKGDDLTQQHESNLTVVEAEKDRIRKELMTKAANCDFEESLSLLSAKASREERQRVYTQTISIAAQSYSREAPISKARHKLDSLHRRFVGLDRDVPVTIQELIEERQVGEVKVTEIEDAFTSFINEKGIEQAMNTLRDLPAKERALFSEREAWLNGHNGAVEMARKYFYLVADTGEKYGPGWDTRRKGTRNKSSVGNRLKAFGWTARTTQEQAGDQIWIQAITKNKLIAQVRRYTNDGTVLPSGTEDIPHWETTMTGVMHYIASDKKVRELLGDDFPQAHAAYEFYVRSPEFKKVVEKGASGSTVDFLNSEIDKCGEAWNPEWAPKCVSRALTAMRFMRSSNRARLKTYVESILGELDAFKEKQEEFDKLLSDK